MSQKRTNGGQAIERLDKNWAFPFEVMVIVMKIVYHRYARDFAGRYPITNPTRIIPLLCTNRAILDHLLPLLYHSIHMHTHSQLSAFLHHVPPISVAMIQQFTLEVDYIPAPPKSCVSNRRRYSSSDDDAWDHINPNGKRNRPRMPLTDEEKAEREYFRLRDLASEERELVENGCEAMEKRCGIVIEAMRTANDQRTIVVKRTSPASCQVAQCLHFPILHWDDYEDPPFLSRGVKSKVKETFLVPPARTIRIGTDILHLDDVQELFRRCVKQPFVEGERPIIEPETSKLRELYIQLAPVPMPERFAPGDWQWNRQSDCLKEILGYLPKVTMVVSYSKPEGEDRREAHFFCEGQPGEEWRVKDERLTYVTCKKGECPFAEASS